MNTTTALPPKAAKATCTECGLTAAPPIVVLVRHHANDWHPSIGRCADRKACEVRQLRAKNRAKEAQR